MSYHWTTSLAQASLFKINLCSWNRSRMVSNLKWRVCSLKIPSDVFIDRLEAHLPACYNLKISFCWEEMLQGSLAVMLKKKKKSLLWLISYCKQTTENPLTFFVLFVFGGWVFWPSFPRLVPKSILKNSRRLYIRVQALDDSSTILVLWNFCST